MRAFPSEEMEGIIATLPAGNYTAVIRGKNNTTGVGLVEAYQLQNLFWSTRARLVDYLLQAIC